jgi:hypothetical protein
MENIFFGWTLPNDDWLVGIEYAPENIVTDLETNDETQVAVLSIGLLFFRIDILIN